MKHLILVVFLIPIVGCNPPKSMLKQERKTWGYEHWANDFKDRTLCKCLIAGYGSKIADSIMAIDKTYYDPIAITIFDQKIDSILKTEVLKMSSDSLISLTTVAEGAAGKTVFSHCMNFYRSNELNSIVKIESAKWKKIKNIDSLVQKVISSF